MSEQFGPFQYIYSQREQKQRRCAGTPHRQVWCDSDTSNREHRATPLLRPSTSRANSTSIGMNSRCYSSRWRTHSVGAKTRPVKVERFQTQQPEKSWALNSRAPTSTVNPV